MHLTVLVVSQRVLLKTIHHNLVCNHDFIPYFSLHRQFQDIQKFTGIASAVSQQGSRLLQLDILLLQDCVFVDGSVEQFQQIVFFERLEHIELTTRQEWTDDLERRILRRGTYQGDDTLLHSPQQGVLLRLRETVDLVYK